MAYQSLDQGDLTSDSAAIGFRFLAEVDEDYTFTKGIVYNNGDSPIELRDARVESVPMGLTVLGVTVAPAGDLRNGPSVFGPGFPPPEVDGSDNHAVPGLVVQPGTGIRVLVGIHVSMPGIHDLSGITLSYGSSLLGRSIVFPHVVRICAPTSEYWTDMGTVVGCEIPNPPANNAP